VSAAGWWWVVVRGVSAGQDGDLAGLVPFKVPRPAAGLVDRHVREGDHVDRVDALPGLWRLGVGGRFERGPLSRLTACSSAHLASPSWS
jgi:hypothetical protein